MSDIVFILGAGASRQAGAPLMNDFIDTAESLLRADECGAEKAAIRVNLSVQSDRGTPTPLREGRRRYEQS